jgi:4-amino-4-deoxy-L-arabinose transferase-like glycosyltransferase
VSGGWWVAIVALWPVGSRPFIDGSPDNSIFNLILGYNGLGRIFGATGPGGGGGGANFSGAAGVLRLFNDAMAGQASWLLPAALIALVVGLWASRRTPRTDRTRAALLLWGGWLIVSGLVFSLSSGIIHTYYTVALAPAIAALVAITATMLWRIRATLSARVLMALTVLLTAIWSWVLLDHTPQWESWLRVVILASAAVALAGVLGAPALRRIGRRVTIATAVFAAVACLAGPIAYSAQTITTAHTGSIPAAGPSSGGVFGGGGGRQGGSVNSALVKALQSGSARYRWVAAVSGSQNAASLELATGGAPVMAIGGFNNEGGNLTLAQFQQYVASGDIHYYIASTGGPGGGGVPAHAFAGGPGGGSGADGFGPAGGVRPTGAPPGGRAGGGAGAPGGASASTSAITTWVKGHYRAVTIGGQTVYDLTQPLSG